jgi:hypothetical protein
VVLLPHSTHKLQPLGVGYFGPLSHYYGMQVDDFCRYGHSGVNKGGFFLSSTDTICRAWKVTGLPPYNPTAVLETLTRTKPSKSQGIEELNIPTTLRTPKTPRTIPKLNIAISSRAVLNPVESNQD